jgi:hypothetical protein
MSCERHTAPAGQRSGVLISTPYAGGPAVEQDTVSCKHCGYTWLWQPGSGRRRGWCSCCHGIVCGRPCCAKLGCVPQEQQLENLEAGRALDFRPIVVSTPGVAFG